MIRRVSLIICTRNRATQLRKCLASVSSLEAPSCEWELVVVDNGSTDTTAAVIDECARSAAFPVRYALEPAAGLSRARNRGIATATGDILLFTDDDCYPESGYLRAAVETLQQPQVDYFAGRVLLHDPTDAPTTIKTSTRANLIGPRSFFHPGMIHGANMGFHRRVTEKIGGFNEALGAGSSLSAGEDVEYLARASAAGFSGGYFPGPTVSHHHGRKPGELDSLNWGYNVGRGAYYASMMVHTDSGAQFLREWLGSITWRHPRKGLGEIWGGIKFWFVYRSARADGRSLIPRMDRKA